MAARALAAVLPARVLLSRPLLACFGITAALHLATVLLNTLLPLHVTALGGTKTQVGLLFSVTTLVGMFLRPMVGAWVDRHGAARVIAPGSLLLLMTSLAFHAAVTPAALIALMLGVGVASSLISTPASIHAAVASPSTHRGEVLGTYYLFSSLPIAVAPALALALFRGPGVGGGFVVVTAMALAVGAFALVLAAPPARSGLRAPHRRWVDPDMFGLAGVLILTTFGHSAIYGFVPLHALAQGRGDALGWFFGVYSGWLILCRALLRGVSDRVGRTRVLGPAIATITLGYAVLALPPTVPSLVVAALCLASGGSLLYPTLIALVVDRTPPAERGVAIGTVSGAWDVGIVIGSTVVGVIVEHGGFPAGFVTGAVVAGAGLGVFLLGERRRADAGGRRP